MKISVIKGTVIEERVRTFNFHFHGTTSLEFDLYQNGCEFRHTYYIYVYFAESRCIIINLTNILIFIFKSAILKVSTCIIQSLLGSHCIKKEHLSCRSRHYTYIVCSWKRRVHLFHAADMWTVLSKGSAFQIGINFQNISILLSSVFSWFLL